MAHHNLHIYERIGIEIGYESDSHGWLVTAKVTRVRTDGNLPKPVSVPELEVK